MDKPLIEGGVRLHRRSPRFGAKERRAAHPCAPLLTRETLLVENVPHLRDVTTMLSLPGTNGRLGFLDEKLGVELCAAHIPHPVAP